MKHFRTEGDQITDSLPTELKEIGTSLLKSLCHIFKEKYNQEKDHNIYYVISKRKRKTLKLIVS